MYELAVATVPYAMPVAAGSAAVWVVAALWRRSSKEGSPIENIDKMVRPFEDAILRTKTPPGGHDRIDVESWGDLVKVAESLGKPILRLYGGAGGSEGRLFYVRDGPLCYLFEFAGAPISSALAGGYATPAPMGRGPTKPPAPVSPGPGAPGFTSVSMRESGLSLVSHLPGPEGPGPVLGETLEASADELRHQLYLPQDADPEVRVRQLTGILLERLRGFPPESYAVRVGTDLVRRALEQIEQQHVEQAEIDLISANWILDREERERKSGEGSRPSDGPGMPPDPDPSAPASSAPPTPSEASPSPLQDPPGQASGPESAGGGSGADPPGGTRDPPSAEARPPENSVAREA
jgi:hypothetical protein